MNNYKRVERKMQMALKLNTVAKKTVLLLTFTAVFLSILAISGTSISYAEGWKSYNSNGVNFETGSFIRQQGWHTPDNKFDTIQVFADQSDDNLTTLENPTANGVYPTVNYSFSEAGFSEISSIYEYTTSKEVVVSGFSLGHMYTTYSNLGIKQVIKLDGADANNATRFSEIKVYTNTSYYLEFGNIDTSIRPQFTATPSLYNGISYNLYSVSRPYITSDDGTYNLSGLNLGSNIRWPDDNIYSHTLVQDPNVPQNGVYIKDSLAVASYNYKPLMASAGINVKYLDSSSYQEIMPSITLTGNVGESYQSEQQTIPGYTFKEVQGVPAGLFTNQLQTVTYLYTKAPVLGGVVTIKYIDDNNNEMSPNIVKTGNVGESYQSEQQTIPGYTFKEVQGVPAGLFTDQPQTVTYVYTKSAVLGGAVTIRYVDGDGNIISSDVVKTGNIGESYQSEQQIIPGYTFKETQGDTTGLFTDQLQTVTYVYERNNTIKLPVKNLDIKVKNTTPSSLPQTGDNNRSSIKYYILGLVTILFGVILAAFHLKRSKI